MPDLPNPLLPTADRNKKPVYEPDDIDWSVDMLEMDKEMFDLAIDHPDWQADQWKIYPCQVVPWTRLKLEYENGAYKPYSDQHMDHKTKTPLIELLIDVHSRVKPWVRLNRVIRDIPTDYITGGNYDTSLRQKVDDEMKRRGLYCMDIRNREVKKRNISPELAELRVRKYEASGGWEYFISFETADGRILFGFLRLRISEKAGAGAFPELENTALIRELHVYGSVTKVGQDSSQVQHVGFGKRLLENAFQIAKANGYNRIAVISGIGVKNYYRRFGFEDEGAFMIKMLPKESNHININMYNYGLIGIVLSLVIYIILITFF
jgi:ELP3 family radical SAM enzyme/protein acetyltransferase